MPELQFHVYDQYGRLLKQGEDPGEVVFQEKRREDQIREATQFSMGRIIWRDFYSPAATGARFRRLLGLAA